MQCWVSVGPIASPWLFEQNLALCFTHKMETNENMRRLKWTNYSDNLYQLQKSIYGTLRDDEYEYDTLLVSSDGRVFKSHRLILSGSSDFLHMLLKDVPLAENPTIHMPDVNSTVLESLLSFIYLGEVDMPMVLINVFLDMCNYLQIKGVSSAIQHIVCEWWCL